MLKFVILHWCKKMLIIFDKIYNILSKKMKNFDLKINKKNNKYIKL